MECMFLLSGFHRRPKITVIPLMWAYGYSGISLFGAPTPPKGRAAVATEIQLLALVLLGNDGETNRATRSLIPASTAHHRRFAALRSQVRTASGGGAIAGLRRGWLRPGHCHGYPTTRSSSYCGSLCSPPSRRTNYLVVSISTSMPLFRRFWPVTTTRSPSSTPETISYSSPMRRPSSTLL